MSEPLLLINPRRKHRRHKNARRHARRRHRNPRGFRMRRRRHRNPRGFGGLSLSPMSIVRGTIVPAAIGGVGAVGLDVALAYLPLPDSLKSGLPATLVKLLGAIALGFAAGKVIGKDRGRLITLGAVTVMGYQFIRDQAKAALPTVKGLGSYMDYVDYTLMQDRGGMGAYMSPTLAPARLNGLGFISPAPTIQSGGSPMGAYMSPDLAPGFNGFNYESPDGM